MSGSKIKASNLALALRMAIQVQKEREFATCLAEGGRFKSTFRAGLEENLDFLLRTETLEVVP